MKSPLRSKHLRGVIGYVNVLFDKLEFGLILFQTEKAKCGSNKHCGNTDVLRCQHIICLNIHISKTQCANGIHNGTANK